MATRRLLDRELALEARQRPSTSDGLLRSSAASYRLGEPEIKMYYGDDAPVDGDSLRKARVDFVQQTRQKQRQMAQAEKKRRSEFIGFNRDQHAMQARLRMRSAKEQYFR